MDINWLDRIDEPINKVEKYQYQQIMILLRIEQMLNKLMPKEEQIAVEEVTVTDIETIDYESLTKQELLNECDKQGIKATSRDSKADLVKKLVE